MWILSVLPSIFLETFAHRATEDLNDAAFGEALRVDPALAVKSTLSGSGWSDITYLDENFRLMRGNQQNLYVLQRVDKGWLNNSLTHYTSFDHWNEQIRGMHSD